MLVVGAGLAGARTVQTLRAEGFEGSIRVLGDEGVLPYDRPPLSKELLTRPAPAWLRDELDLDLAALADEVHLAGPARGLRLRAGGVQVLTEDGAFIAGHVIVATGAHAVRPPRWEAALTLHTADDARRLRAALAAGGPLVVVGAGWIGAEVAGVVAAAGIDVTVLEGAPTPLHEALGGLVGALTMPWYAAAGVQLVTDARVDVVDGAGVTLTNGRRFPAPTVLAAVGARPSTLWLGGVLPVDRSGALRVDAAYRVLDDDVPVPGLWAVGDVAVRRSARHGWVAGGHWDGALRGPQALARALVRDARPDMSPPEEPVPDPAPYVFSTQLGHDVALFGLPGDGCPVVLRGDPAAGDGWTALWVSGDVVHAVLVVDRPHDVGAARRLMSGATLPRVDVAAVADPALPLRAARPA